MSYDRSQFKGWDDLPKVFLGGTARHNSDRNGAGVEFFNLTNKASEANSGCIFSFHCPVSQLHWHCLALSYNCTDTVNKNVPHIHCH